jgi:TPR repeat protein
MPRNRLPLVALVLLMLATPAVNAGFDQAAAAFDKGDYATALRELKPLVEKGDARSQYAMGVLAENGYGMPKNLAQAADWYRKAAEQGNTDAQFNLGAMYEHGVGMPVNYVEAARWYRPAAEAGDIDALSNLGVLYATGRGVRQDKVLALTLYNLSVAFDSNKQGQAARNGRGLVGQMTVEEINAAMALTRDLLKPGQLKPGLQAQWKRAK